MTYRSLMKLLRSYFENEVLLIPLLDKEWLILARKELLTGGDDKEDEEESAEDLLSQTSMGLHELIASEWVGVFHLAVSPAIIPVKGLTGSVALLRETIILGRIFQVGDYIHLPWELHMERLVNSIPDDRRRQLLGQIGDYTAVLADKEMLLTLETFLKWTAMSAKPRRSCISTGIRSCTDSTRSNRKREPMSGVSGMLRL